jgi:hypothetical protein
MLGLRAVKIMGFLILFFLPILGWGEAGKLGPGLARLISALPPEDPMALRFQRFLKEIQDSQPGVRLISATDLGAAQIARFIPLQTPERKYVPGESPYQEVKHLAIFEYNPDKLRIIDFLEEEQHWEQIKKGLHLRDWSRHPLAEKFPERGTILVMEDLAKRALLEKHDKEMSWDLREELKNELKLVWEGNYGATGSAHIRNNSPMFSKTQSAQPDCARKFQSLRPIRPIP